MDTTAREDPPPKSTDVLGWRQAITDGRFRNFKMEAIIAAIQDLGLKTDKMVLNPLVLHASDTIVRILRSKVGRNHSNEGEDIITRAHGQLIQAMLNPDCADGKGLRVAFIPRIQFRVADAIRAEQKKEKRERVNEDIENLPNERPRQEIDPRQELDEQMDVERVLSHIADGRKRLAFRLHMEGYPLTSKRSASIAKALGISSKTAGLWIEEVRAQLSNIVGEQSYDQSKQIRRAR